VRALLLALPSTFPAVVFTIVCSGGAAAWAGPAGPPRASAADLQTIVIRMEKTATVSRERAYPYVLTRKFQIFARTEAQPYSQVVADVHFVPPASKTFQIVDRSGSSRGEGIVRRLLETESKAASSGDGEVTRDNYDFALLGETLLKGNHCYLLRLSAKRDDQRLVNGEAWVDADTYEIRRIEGEMAKLPSWWLRSVAVTISFASVGGMWMQTGMTAVAEVRILGKRTFTSRVVSLRMASVTPQEGSAAAARLGN
jgi:hypothetical protein